MTESDTTTDRHDEARPFETGGAPTADTSGLAQEPPAGPGGSGALPRGPWYRSARFVVPIAIVVAIGIAVVTDLPAHSSRASQLATARAVVTEIRTSVHPCSYALNQAFELLNGEAGGTLKPSERARVPGYLRDDLQACSYASTSIFSLSTITVPNSPAGRQLGTVIKTVLQWCTSDGVGAITDIESLVANPHDTSAADDLPKRMRLLASDRAQAHSQLQRASTDLGRADLGTLGLPALPSTVS